MAESRHFTKLKKKHSKAQISIDFIAGFGIFIMVVGYVLYTAMMIFPKYYEQSNENAIREEAWTLSVNVMDYLKGSTAIDDQSLASLSGCRIYHYFDDPTTDEDNLSRANYTYFKNRFNVDGSNDFRILVKSSPVVMTDYAKGRNKTGNMTIDGVEYMFELFNATSLEYDAVSISDGSTVVTADENDTVSLGKYTLNIDNIDSKGKFLIMGLEDPSINCGKHIPMTGINSKVRRFTTYNKWITAVDVVYW